MENKATQVLGQKIYETRETIIQNKLEIADLFIKIHNAKSPMLKPDFNAFTTMVSDMEKMSKALAKLSENEARLKALTKSKEEIEKAYMDVYVK